MNKCILTQAVFESETIFEISRPTFERYADTHGYELVVRTDEPEQLVEHRDHTVTARARKIQLIKETLRLYDTLLWLDTDVMISRYDKDILDDLPEDCFQGLIMELHPYRIHPNTGVWLLRNTEQTHNFLDANQAMDQPEHVWVDQSKVMKLLGWDLGDYGGKGAKPAKGSEYLEDTAWLPPEWNPLGLLRGMKEARFHHYTGMDTPARVNVMTEELNRQSDVSL